MVASLLDSSRSCGRAQDNFADGGRFSQFIFGNIELHELSALDHPVAACNSVTRRIIRIGIIALETLFGPLARRMRFALALAARLISMPDFKNLLDRHVEARCRLRRSKVLSCERSS
jgi:hypothetical protein